MTENQWREFARRVSPGIRVMDFGVEGILLETYPWSALEINIEARHDLERDGSYDEINPTRLKWQRISGTTSQNNSTLSCVDALMYRIQNRWLFFHEVMALTP